MFHPVSSIASTNETFDWSHTIDLCKKLLLIPEVARSQEITNSLWKVLNKLGVKYVFAFSTCSGFANGIVKLLFILTYTSNKLLPCFELDIDLRAKDGLSLLAIYQL